MGLKGTDTFGGTMRALLNLVIRLRHDRRGQDLSEYALMLVLVSFIIYGWLPNNYTPALSTLWQRVKDVLCTIGGACES